MGAGTLQGAGIGQGMSTMQNQDKITKGYAQSCLLLCLWELPLSPMAYCISIYREKDEAVPLGEEVREEGCSSQ